MGSMNENPRNLKKLVAGTAAVIFTVAAAGAAVAVNLGTADPASGSPAGKLASTQPVLATPVDTITPSTIYLDVDVPVQGTASDPATTSGSGTATDPSSPGATASGPSSSSHSDAGGDSIDPDSHDESDDSDRKDKAGEEREHKDGAEDDD